MNIIYEYLPVFSYNVNLLRDLYELKIMIIIIIYLLKFHQTQRQNKMNTNIYIIVYIYNIYHKATS